jgi:hypothetical protein
MFEVNPDRGSQAPFAEATGGSTTSLSGCCGVHSDPGTAIRNISPTGILVERKQHGLPLVDFLEIDLDSRVLLDEGCDAGAQGNDA